MKLPEGFVIDQKPDNQSSLPSGFVVDVNQSTENEKPGLLRRTGDLALESAKNLPSSSLNLLNNVGLALLHPLDTAQSLGEVAFGGVEKLIPGEQKHESKFNAIADFYKNRYGSLQGVTDAIAKDPAGVAADMAGLLTGIGGTTSLVGKAAGINPMVKAGNVISKAGVMSDPVNLAVTGTGKLLGGKAAESIYASASKMGTTKGVPARKAAVNTALEKGLMPSESGLNVMQDAKTALGESIGAVVDEATASGDLFKRDLLFKHLREAVNKAEFGPGSASVKKQIFNEMNQIRNQHPKDITPRAMQNIKTEFQHSISQNDWGKTATGLKEARKQISRAAREVLQERYPELKGLNTELAEYRNLEKELERAASRIGNRDPLGMTKMLLATGGGATAGIEGAAAGLGLGLVLDPRVQSKVAILLRSLKKKGLSRDPKIYAAREAARQGGIVQDQTDKQ